MSTPGKTRKTAFARKPRGDKSSAEQPKKVIINRDFLMKLKEPRLDESLNDILTSTGGVLTLEFRAQGGSSVTIVDKRNETIADNNDVMRVLTMNSFLTKEKSKVIKESAKGSIVRVLWAIKEYVRGQPAIELPEEIPQQMRDVIARMQTVLQTLKGNYDQVSEYQAVGDSAEAKIKNYLEITNLRIRNAIVNYLVKKFTDYDEAGTINAELRKRKVPLWVYSKLTSQKLNLLQKGYEFKSILFPKDPSKGVCYSFAEIRDDEFCRAQGNYMMRASFVPNQFMKDNAFIQDFCNIEDVTDEETMKLLANVPVLLPEPQVNAASLVDSLADQGIRQYSWPVGYAVSPKDNLQFLGTLFKRASVVALVRPQYKIALIEQLFPGFVYNASNRTANVFQQLKANPGEGGAYFSASVLVGNTRRYNGNAASRKATFELLVDILEVSPQDTARRSCIRRILTIDENGEYPAGIPNWVIPPAVGYDVETDKWGPIAAGANAVDPKNVGFIELDQSTRRETGRKKEKKVSLIRQTVANRTLLTSEAKMVLVLLASIKYKALVPSLEAYFRAFLTTAVQAAVARLMYARIAAVLAKPTRLGKKDLADLLDLDAVTALGDTLGDEADETKSDSDSDEEEDEQVADDVPDEPVVA